MRISDAEWDVMEVVWRRGTAVAADVIEDLAAPKGWNHRTIRTLLARLVEKGALRYEVDGKRYVYRPHLSRERCVRREGRSFLDKIFDGDVKSLVVHFVEQSDLPPEQVAELRRVLNAAPGRRK